MATTVQKNSKPMLIWLAIAVIAAILAIYPVLFKPIKDTPATEGQSFQNVPAPTNEPAAP